MKPSEYSLQLAAQAWCEPETEQKTMDVELATAFAGIIDGERARLVADLKKPNLGLATNADLLDELRARIELHWALDYKTLRGEEICASAEVLK